MSIESGFPFITTKLPSNIEVEEGETIKLVAKFDGDAETKVEWICNNIALKPSENVIMFQNIDGTVSLEITFASQTDSGEYELRVTNSKGSAKSSSNVKVSSEFQFW